MKLQLQEEGLTHCPAEFLANPEIIMETQTYFNITLS